MKMRDLIDLVRAGLKPAEIKEMIELEKQAADINIDETDETDDKDEPKKNMSKDDNEAVKLEDEPKLDNDLSLELKKAQDEIASLKAQINTIQQENKSKDISNQQDKSLDEQIIDIFNQML